MLNVSSLEIQFHNSICLPEKVEENEVYKWNIILPIGSFCIITIVGKKLLISSKNYIKSLYTCEKLADWNGKSGQHKNEPLEHDTYISIKKNKIKSLHAISLFFYTL